MELFRVDRYWGDKVSKKVQKNDHLSRLLEKIEQRKKLKNSFDQQQDVLVDDSERPPEKKKKKKKQHHRHKPESIVEDKEDEWEDSGNVHKNDEWKESGNVDKEDEWEDSSNVENKNIDKDRLSEEINSDVSDESEEEIDSEKHKSDNELLTDTHENEAGDFMVIGDYKFNKKKKVRHMMPEWLTKPSLISTDLKNLTVTVDDIPELDEKLVEILKKNNFTHFFPVQAELIPFLLKMDEQSHLMWPRDVCISSPTGSGKTLAFVLPIVQILQKKFGRRIRALVVLPVQDLAAQVARVFETFTAHTELKVVLTTGSTNLEAEQKRLVRKRYNGEYESLADILVTTPGRLVEHIMSTEGFRLMHLQFIVIDEADRVMDRIQHDWLYYLEKNISVPGCPKITVKNLTTLPKRPQKLLYSATLSVDPEKLSQLNLMRPKLYTSIAQNKVDQEGGNEEFVGQFTTPTELTEYMTVCEPQLKPLVVYQLLAKNKWHHVLIFTMSRKSAHVLAVFLQLISTKVEHGFQVAEISSNLSIAERDKVLSYFASNKIDVLISTDALTRGMDIPDIECVISYDVPKKITAYVHRVGRTGRAGKEGTAITISTQQQLPLVRKFMRKTGKEITELTVPESELVVLESVYQETLSELKARISREESSEKKKIKEMRRQSEGFKKILAQKLKLKKRKMKRQNEERAKKQTKIKTPANEDHSVKKKSQKKSVKNT